MAPAKKTKKAKTSVKKAPVKAKKSVKKSKKPNKKVPASSKKKSVKSPVKKTIKKKTIKRVIEKDLFDDLDEDKIIALKRIINEIAMTGGRIIPINQLKIMSSSEDIDDTEFDLILRYFEKEGKLNIIDDSIEVT